MRERMLPGVRVFLFVAKQTGSQVTAQLPGLMLDGLRRPFRPRMLPRLGPGRDPFDRVKRVSEANSDQSGPAFVGGGLDRYRGRSLAATIRRQRRLASRCF